jgi:hypothetical protein
MVTCTEPRGLHTLTISRFQDGKRKSSPGKRKGVTSPEISK